MLKASGRAALRAPGTSVRWTRTAIAWARVHPGEAAYIAAALFAVWSVYSVVALRSELTYAESLDCLALNIYHEARGESDEAQLAVAMVVMNRTAHPSFPDTVCSVVKQGGEWPHNRCQFSWWCDGRSDVATDDGAFARSRNLAADVLRSKFSDPTKGSLWYHAIDVTPSWSKEFAVGPTIGSHVFYGPPPGS